MMRLVFFHPEIPPNTGNAIRLSAVTGCELHLIEPLGFTLEDSKLRRAGLDYHDLARMTVHPNLEAAWETMQPERVFAFTSKGSVNYTDITYQDGDVLLFGPESVGLPDDVLDSDRVTAKVKIPMLPGRRSLNLANSASIALYEAWRQNGFEGAPL
ncbi:tRNA (cytidine(34)-2'-O)-methyltransferase [Nakamurella silvestris]|nr:tRNA (cytidine(34)-2'-O)-methyltransferase [Nakamurella silvestris]